MSSAVKIHLAMAPVQGKDWLEGGHRRALMDDLDALLGMAFEAPVTMELDYQDGPIELQPAQWLERSYTLDSWSVGITVQLSSPKLRAVLEPLVAESLSLKRAEAARGWAGQLKAWWHTTTTKKALSRTDVDLEECREIARGMSQTLEPILLREIGMRTHQCFEARREGGVLFLHTQEAGYPVPEMVGRPMEAVPEERLKELGKPRPNGVDEPRPTRKTKP